MDKYDFIMEHIEEARRRDPRDLYITFSSAVTLKAIRYAKVINPRLSNCLAESPSGRVGIIVMDYFEEPRELVSNVIRMNRWIRRSAVTSSGHEPRDLASSVHAAR